MEALIIFFLLHNSLMTHTQQYLNFNNKVTHKKCIIHLLSQNSHASNLLFELAINSEDGPGWLI